MKYFCQIDMEQVLIVGSQFVKQQMAKNWLHFYKVCSKMKKEDAHSFYMSIRL